MDKLKELKVEADELGVKYSPNIGQAKLQEKIDAYYESQETSSKATLASVKEREESEESDPFSEEPTWTDMKRRKLSAEREKAARKTRIITIIDNDQRVNNQTTTASVNCSNSFFDLGQVILPLNMEVEVMQGHIDVLKAVQIPQHVKDPVTGLHKYVLRNRYTISYSDKQPD